MVYAYYSDLCEGFENEKKKGIKDFTFRSRDLNP
jgi:hypothetical protein